MSMAGEHGNMHPAADDIVPVLVYVLIKVVAVKIIIYLSLLLSIILNVWCILSFRRIPLRCYQLFSI